LRREIVKKSADCFFLPMADLKSDRTVVYHLAKFRIATPCVTARRANPEAECNFEDGSRILAELAESAFA
jgi:hypothetical protein